MNAKKHKWILYLIIITIIATFSVQFYWNFNNYLQNKQRVINEIRLSLDNSIEEYFAELAKENFTTIINIKGKNNIALNDQLLDSVFKENEFLKHQENNDSIDKKKTPFNITNISISSEEEITKEKADSILKGFQTEFYKKESVSKTNKSSSKELRFFKGKKAADSLRLIQTLKPIFFSINSSFIEYDKLDSLLIKQLENKGILTEYNLNHFKNDTVFFSSKRHLSNLNLIVVDAKSTFLKDNEAFTLQFKNPNLEALKRSSFGISISLLLSLSVIFSLFYLLKVINQQKEVALVKNDLISNITHEFKTPIATVSTAIEALENFNALEDKEKTKKYLAMSSIQLKKLHLMVEKLLETAALDSEQLILKKEPIILNRVIEKQIAKHQFITTKKEILFSSDTNSITLSIDVFHFENVLSNLLDNAIKYGGNKIEVHIKSDTNATEITITDNGNGIDKNLHEKVFQKFYRIPKGNTHDIKGFGIGLYYSKKIIEKHNGFLSLTSTKTKTTFKITLPNA